MIKIFDTLEKYNTYTNNGQCLESGNIYFVKEDNSTHYFTNNIDGVSTIYDTVETPSGNIEITENAESLDIAQYASASVNVPIPPEYIIPTGNVSINQNGENINVHDYASASVNVPIPPEYIIPTGNVTINQNGTDINVHDYATATVAVPQPSGSISITENGNDIDIAQYATANVNVSAPSKNYIVESAEYDPTATYSGSFNATKMVKGANIPNGFTSCSFQNYTELEFVNLPNSITSLGYNAFSNCSKLKRIGSNNDGECIIPNTVTTIGESAFATYGSDIHSLSIGSGVTSIFEATNTNPFQMFALNSVTVDSQNSTYDSRNNCNAIIKTSTNNLLLGCNSTVIPNTVTEIGDKAFQYCDDLTTINVPDSVTKINNYAFSIPSYKRKLTDIVIGTGITFIGQTAFGSDSSLFSSQVNITIKATTPPSTGINLFKNLSNYTIYVPAESVEAYKAASGWSTYASRIQAIPSA